LTRAGNVRFKDTRQLGGIRELKASPSMGRLSQRREQDDRLIQFLNSSEAKPGVELDLTQPALLNESERHKTAAVAVEFHQAEDEEVDSSYNSGRSSVETAVVEDVIENGVGRVGDAFQLAPGEERLLRDEVTFLNQESTRLLARARQAENEVRSLKGRLEEEGREGQRQEETISRLVKEKEELKDWLTRQKKIHQEDLANIRLKHEQQLLTPDQNREDFQKGLIANATDEEGVTRLKEALVLQQQQLELVTREKNNLIHRVEHLEKKSEEQSHGGKRYQMLLEEGLHLEERRPFFLQESPFDGAAARQAKRVYTSIDKLSVRVGATLRRYPVARLFVFLYIVALQLWVLLVLFSQTPENSNSAPDQG